MPEVTGDDRGEEDRKQEHDEGFHHASLDNEDL
jgi:hypothetical protein